MSACFTPENYPEAFNKLVNYHYSNDVYSLSVSEKVSYGFLGPLSLVTGVVLLYFYVKKPELRKPPGMLIMWQCFAQTVSDINWTASGVNFYYL
jgi:hypothetical protein